MNDPKDIIVTISLGKDEENISIDRSMEKEDKDNLPLTEEVHFNNLYYHLKENLSKKFYKKTIKEIETLYERQYLNSYSQEWKISILKIRALLKIIKKKIIKYLINHYEKAKIKHHIYGIKKYFNQIPIEFNKFYEKNKNIKIEEEPNMIDSLLLCYFEYIYLISFFHKKLGNVMDAITYLSFILRLFKETHLIVKTMGTIHKMEKCFILLTQMLINNEDYFSCFEYLNIAMDISLKNIIYQIKDVNDGVYHGDKKQAINNFYKKSIRNGNKNKESDIEDTFGDIKIKKIIINIVYIYFYRGVCYENIGKMKNSIRCYNQCLWFLDNFFINSYRNLSTLIKSILEKTREFKETFDYLVKKIKHFNHLQLNVKSQIDKNEEDKDEKNDKILKNLYSKKFKKLVNKLDKLKIYEIDTVNKFDVKKNIKGLNSVKREGKDKNIFLSDIRLLNAYLRDDFRIIIDKMDKIKSYDIDYPIRENIQKLIRKIYFERSQNNIKYNQKKKSNFYFSTFSKKNESIKNESIKNKRYELIKEQQNLSSKLRVKSALAKEKTKIFFPQNSYKSVNRNQSISYMNLNNLNKENKNGSKEIFKKGFLKKSKRIRFNSTGSSSRNKIYKENKELNNFFNKKYLEKRNYIKKLEDRELSFQKFVLKLKNTPKAPIPVFIKEIIKQNANESFEKMMTLLVSIPMNWKEQLSQEEVKNVMAYDKLENAVIRSLDNKSLVKFKIEEQKLKPKNTYDNSGFNFLVKNKENNNQDVIDKLNIKLELLKQREIIENKNYKKLLLENRKYIKHRNERHSHFNSSCIVCRKNRDENNSRNNILKKSNSSPYFYD